MNNMLTLEEVKNFLEISQDQMEKFIKEGKLKAYKIGGTYVRFRKDDIMNVRVDLLSRRATIPKSTMGSKIADFWRFNNFYIVSLIFVVALILFVIRF